MRPTIPDKAIHDADIPLETWLAEYRIQVLRDLLAEH